METSKQHSRIKVIIPQEVVLATSIYDFCMSNGRRRMRQPFWLASTSEMPDGKHEQNFFFDFIDEKTDVAALIKRIEAGTIYTLPAYTEHGKNAGRE